MTLSIFRQAILPLLLFFFSQLKAQVTFQTPPIISMPQTPQELAKGDFNNDGQVDFVAVNFNGLSNQQVTILLNSGSGTFTGSNKRNFASRRNPLDVAVGDFNEDGNLDVVTVSQENTDAVSLLLGDGAGNLAAPIHFNAGDTPQAIAVDDMDKDDNLDMLVTNRGTPSDVYIFFGDGLGGFSAPTIITIANVWDIATADFNGDTNPDFAITVSSNVQVWFGDGSGTNYTPGSLIPGFNSTEDILAVNLDDDTDVDLIAGGGYSLNDGTGMFAPRIILAQTGSEYTVADLNNDTHPDIISNDNNVNTTNVRVFLGNGAGVFTLLAKFETNGYHLGLEAADVNNDTEMDIVGIGGWGGVHMADILLGDGTGYFSNSVIKYPTPTDPRDLVKGDFNEDGIIDVAMCHSVGNIVTIYLGQGGGKFAKTTTNYTTGAFPTQVLAFDFNNDSHLDLATYNQSASSVTVLTGGGDGSFALLGNFGVTSTVTGRITSGDFNNDTNADLVVSGNTSRVINFLSGTGSGFSASVTTPVSGDIIEIKAADFNGDGNLDLVANLSNINRMVLITGNGSGSFTEGTTQYQHAGSFFLIEDLNNDSNLDVIAFSNSSSGNDFFVNDGLGNFTGSSIAVSLGGFPWGYADMDGDGFKDLIVGSQNSISSQPGQIVIFKGTLSGISSNIHIDKDYSGGNRLVIHDVNGDSKPDIVATSFNIYEDYLGTLINNTVLVGCPMVTTQPTPQTACAGQNITFTVSASGNAPLAYQWLKNSVNIPGATNPSLTLPAVSLADAGTYRCFISNGCGSATTNSVSLTVNASPSSPTTTGASACQNANVVLTAMGGVSGQYRWYLTASGGSPISGAVNNTYTTPTLGVSTAYYVAIHNGSCESTRASVLATINSQPGKPNIASSITPVGNAVTICSTNPLTLSAPTGFSSYLWSDSSTTPQITIGVSGSYSLMVTDANGCASPISDPVVVNVIPAPCNNQPPVIGPAQLSTILGGKVIFDLISLVSDADNNIALSTLIVLQQPISGAPATINGSNLEIDYSGNDFVGMDRLTIQVCDLFGECAQRQLEIEVAGDLVIYSGISPNGDSRNEKWIIGNIELLDDTKENRVSIYNRWGDLVFETINYNNDQNSFIGVNKNGNPLSSGVYFYKIEFKGGREAQTGYLSIKK